MDCEFHVIIVVSIITNVTVYFLMLLLERGEGGHNLWPTGQNRLHADSDSCFNTDATNLQQSDFTRRWKQCWVHLIFLPDSKKSMPGAFVNCTHTYGR